MSNYSFLVAGLLTATMLSTSSASAAEKPSFGVLGGLHLANLAFDPDPTDATLDFMRRPSFGGFVELGLTPSVLLQARCMWVQKGAAATFANLEDGIDLSATAAIDYLTVPVLLKIQIDNPKFRPYAVVGPELGFKIRTGASLAVSAAVPADALNMAEEELSKQVSDFTKSTDVALEFGGGMEIPTGRVSILMEGIYALGLRNIAIPSEGEGGSAKTRTFLFNVGVRF